MDRLSRRMVLLGAGALVAVILVAGSLWLAGSIWRPPRTGAELATKPEGHLYLPGATVLGTISEDESRHWIMEPSTGASFTSSLATSQSRDAVLSWYDGQLTHLGWSEGGRDDGSHSQVSASWKRGGGEWFFLDFNSLQMPGSRPAPPGTMVFQVTYTILSGY